MGIQINGQTDTISSTDGSLNIGGTVTVNVTGDATGLTGTPDITVGAVTASSAVISGDLTVNGTTTTLDTTVTEVDRLEVGANNTNVAVAVTQSGTGDILRLYDGTTQAVTVKDGGSVGIGTDNPAEILHLNGASSKSLVRFTSGTYGVSNTDGSHIGINFGGLEVWHKENNYLRFGTDDEERLRITSGGNVGIGTDNPGAKTHIDSTTSNTPLVVEASQNNRSRIVFRNNVETGTECSIELIDDDLRFTTNSGERLRIDVNGKIQINNATPTLEFNGTQQSGTASADLLWNLRDGNANDYDVVKITGQNSGNGGYGDLIVQTAYNNTLKNRIVVSNAGISSFIGYTANTDVLRVHDGTVQINDSLNQNNWQLQVKNTNNSFATGNSLIRAEYTGTNSSDNIKVFSGYVTSESAETCYIAGNGMFYGKGVTALRDNSVLFGKYESGGATIDITSLTSSTWRILEVFGSVNPNSGGSSYVDPLHMYVYNGKGWNGSALTHYIYTQHIAPPARDIFPSGTSNSGNIVDAVWYNGSTESDTCPSNSGSHYVRLKCYNYNTTYGSSFNVRYFVRR